MLITKCIYGILRVHINFLFHNLLYFLKIQTNNNAAERAKLFRILELAYTSSQASKAQSNIVDDKKILVDGSFENISFWFKSLNILQALRTDSANVFVLCGPYNRRKTQKIASLFQFASINFGFPYFSLLALKYAKRFYSSLTCSGDIIAREFLGIPGKFIYDEVLRKQKLSRVVVDHSALVTLYFLALRKRHTDEILQHSSFSYILLSHIHTLDGLALAASAFERNVQLIMVSGAFGGFRLTKLSSFNDFFAISSSVKTNEKICKSKLGLESLFVAGENYLRGRLSGRYDDVGSRFAFGDLSTSSSSVTKSKICGKFDWDIDKPIIGIYASKWFDTPHAYDMKNFQDFEDWIRITLECAKKNNDVNWLLKPHPCDDWYGGVTLRDVFVERNSGNIRYVMPEWRSVDLIDCINGVVTVHGTCGLEFAFSGKTVLCADQGWYSHYGIATVAPNRKKYCEYIKCGWPIINPKKAYRRACEFAGHFYGRPLDEVSYVMPDDFFQDKVSKSLAKLMEDSTEYLARDRELILKWLSEEDPSFRKFKFRQFDSFTS